MKSSQVKLGQVRLRWVKKGEGCSVLTEPQQQSLWTCWVEDHTVITPIGPSEVQQYMNDGRVIGL